MADYVAPLAGKPIYHNVEKWLEENEKYFLPPVCNKMMFNTQLKVKEYVLSQGFVMIWFIL